MKSQIGMWLVDDEKGITGKVNANYNYFIPATSLWSTIKCGEDEVWRWPVHLADKTWMTEEKLIDFNTAFLLALEYCYDSCPNPLPHVLTSKTLLEQKELRS